MKLLQLGLLACLPNVCVCVFALLIKQPVAGQTTLAMSISAVLFVVVGAAARQRGFQIGAEERASERAGTGAIDTDWGPLYVAHGGSSNS